MKIAVEYGDDKLTLEFPDSTIIDEFGHSSEYKATDFDCFRQLLETAEGGLFSLIESDLIIVNDAYRPTPTAKILEWLKMLDRINGSCRFLIATGCHQAPDNDQMRAIFGELYDEYKDRVLVHNARDISSMSRIGEDEEGEPVYLNNAFLKADRVVVIGSVEPHYFAGFTGGRKSIFPGICDAQTTARNHQRAISFEAMPMKLDGNPVHVHLQKLFSLVVGKPIMSIQTVPGLDQGQAIFIGDMQDSFDKANEISREIYGSKYGPQYDLLLAEVKPPLDSSLYQLQKSLENCQRAVADDGTILLFSRCQEGIGSDSFYKLAKTWSPKDDLRKSGDCLYGIHKLHRVYEIGERVNVMLYSELESGVPDKVYFHSLESPQSLVDKLVQKNINLRVGLVHDAGHTVLAN